MNHYKKIELNYSLNALEPFISAKTMDTHYNKHHQGYENGLKAALEGIQLPEEMNTLQGLMTNFQKLENVGTKVKVRRMGGGLINHNFFFSTLKQGTTLIDDSAFYKALIDHFGSFQEFKEIFSRYSRELFGSGWAWLALSSKGKFRIITTTNQDNPWKEKGILCPLIGIDVWEHAYYLDYQNRRPEYVEAFFSVIDWEKVSQLYIEGIEKASLLNLAQPE